MRSGTRVCMAVLAMVGWCAARAMAQGGEAWMSSFPSPERVIELVSGKDEVDTKARQAAALYEMDRLVRRLTGNEFTAKWRGSEASRQLARSYQEADDQLSRAFAAKLNAGISAEKLADPKFARPSKAFSDAAYRYRTNPAFQREVFTDVLGQEWVSKWYEPLVARENAALGRVREQTQRTYEEQKARGEAIAKAQGRRGAAWGLRVLVGLAALGVGTAWVAVTWRRVRLGTPDPYELRGTSKKLASVTGVVSGAQTYTTTETSTYRENPLPGQPGPGALRTSTTTTTHREFFLHTPEGARPFHLVDSSAQLADGQLATCVWVQPKRTAEWREAGSNVLFVLNHDADSWYLRRRTLHRLAGVGFKPFFAFVIAGAALGGFALAALAAIAYFAAWNVGMFVRTRQFKRDEAPHLERLLKERTPLVRGAT